MMYAPCPERLSLPRTQHHKSRAYSTASNRRERGKNILWRNASCQSLCSRDMKARVPPQPGHEKPVRRKKGHPGECASTHRAVSSGNKPTRSIKNSKAKKETGNQIERVSFIFREDGAGGMLSEKGIMKKWRKRRKKQGRTQKKGKSTAKRDLPTCGQQHIPLADTGHEPWQSKRRR